MMGKIFSGNLVGKFIGIIRESVFASAFGTSEISAGYRVAQTAFLVPINFLTADFLSAVLVPLCKDAISEGSNQRDLFINRSILIIMFFGLAITFFTVGLSQEIVNFIINDKNTNFFHISQRMLSIFGLFAIPYMLFNLSSYIDIAHSGSLLTSVRAIVQSIGLILGVMWAVANNDYIFLIVGFGLAYLTICVFSFVYLARKYNIRFAISREALPERKFCIDIWKRLSPLILLPFFIQGYQVFEKWYSAKYGPSVISSIEYAKFISESGIVMIGVPLGFYGLAAFNKIDSESVLKLKDIISKILIFGVPLSMLVAVNSEIVVRVLYGRGNFSQDAISETSKFLYIYSMSAFSGVASYFLIKVMNASNKNKQVSILTATSIAIQVISVYIIGNFKDEYAVPIASLIGSIFLFLASYIFIIGKVKISALKTLCVTLVSLIFVGMDVLVANDYMVMCITSTAYAFYAIFLIKLKGAK